MSTLKTNNVQVGQSGTATNNFTLYQPSTPDGTVRLGNGNSGSVTDVASFTSAGVFSFNSGYGSVATAYGCRAWVNFNGSGTVAIRSSGNVSSISDNGVGDYTVNFTNAMPDANYSINTTGNQGGASANAQVVMLNTASGPTTSAARLCATYINNSGGTGGATDLSYVLVSVFR